MYEGAPFRLTSLMSQKIFDEIVVRIAYTSNNPRVAGYVVESWTVDW